MVFKGEWTGGERKAYSQKNEGEGEGKGVNGREREKS